MQHLILEDRYSFQGKVNEFLRKGWRIVPGTISMVSLRGAANAFTAQGDRTPAGEKFSHVAWCVVEKVDDENTNSI